MGHVIEMKDVRFAYRKHFWHAPHEILKGISLTVDAGEIVALLGMHGAGKTTAIKIINGLLRPTRGEVRAFGMDVKTLAVKGRIGFLPEIPYFYEHLTGYEFLRLHERLSGHGNDREYVYDMLTRMGLKEYDDTPLCDYSRDMLQRIGFAQACINDPPLLVLDQPFDYLNPIQRRMLKRQILDAKQRGVTVLFTSRILPDVVGLCDRVTVIHDGTLVRTGAPGTIINENTDPEETDLAQWILTIPGQP